MLRRIARPLFATWFVVEGLGAALRPADHVTAIRQTAARVPGGDALDKLSDDHLAMAVRAHGAAMTVAAVALGASKAPRTSATVLAALTVPMVIRTLPPPRSAEPTEDGRARRARLVQVLSAVGGALVAAGDTEGRPGVRWKVATARAERAQARQAPQEA
ncbi:MAG: DoxX family protein [Micrococcales bacterium]|nr:DoxX family protein [Micrococcales bacterium]MCL2666901.1 DoxX family protein [Micrococcales bacterium]